MALIFRSLLASISTLIRREHWWAELWSAIVAFLWGTQNFLAAQDLQVLAAYRVLSASFPPLFMELLGLAIGLGQAAALLSSSVIARGMMAGVACWFYSVLLLSFLAAGIPPPGLAFCAGWVGVNMFAVARITRGMK